MLPNPLLFCDHGNIPNVKYNILKSKNMYTWQKYIAVLHLVTKIRILKGMVKSADCFPRTKLLKRGRAKFSCDQHLITLITFTAEEKMRKILFSTNSVV